MFVIGGVNKDKNRFKAVETMLELVISTMELQKHQNMAHPRALCSAVFYNNSVYVVGGTVTNDENGSMNKCERFDLHSCRWSQISDCKVKSCGSALTVFNEKIIKIGGKTDIFTPCSNIELYDPLKDRWTEIDYIFDNGLYSRLPFLSSIC